MKDLFIEQKGLWKAAKSQNDEVFYWICFVCGVLLHLEAYREGEMTSFPDVLCAFCSLHQCTTSISLLSGP